MASEEIGSYIDYRFIYLYTYVPISIIKIYIYVYIKIKIYIYKSKYKDSTQVGGSMLWIEHHKHLGLCFEQ